MKTISADYFVEVTPSVLGQGGSGGAAPGSEPDFVHAVVIGGVPVTIDGDPVVVIF